jgi:formylglycine-generating enzyme required for sulfatase activity
LRDPDSRPIHSISWHEAQAYCAWLNTKLKDTPANERGAAAKLVCEGGWRVALPSELEWEKAARGGLRDAVFSWEGDADVNRANYSDTGINATSAVGCFPANDFGLYDMLGNVWEWTRSPWKNTYAECDFNSEEAGGDARRVVRGGSWFDHRSFSRCAYRSWFHPVSRADNLGFRVVLRSAHVLQSLLLVAPQGGTARRDSRAGRAPKMRADPRERICQPR